MPGQLKDTAPHLGMPGDRSRLRQIEAEVVVRNDFRLPEILHLSGGLEARAPRGRFQRSQLYPAPAQGEVGFRGPGKGTISTERTVRLPQQNVSFIDAAKQRIT